MNRIIISTLAGAAIVVSGMFFHVSAAEEEGNINAKALFESKCSLCHTINRPRSKQKTKEGWTSTVMRMKNRNGAPVTDEEAKTIIDYLSEEYGM